MSRELVIQISLASVVFARGYPFDNHLREVTVKRARAYSL